MKALNYKSLLTAAFLLAVSTLTSNAQTKDWDSTYRPAKYIEKLAEFKAAPIKKKDYVFLGNSITAGGNWAKLLGLPNAKNRGI